MANQSNSNDINNVTGGHILNDNTVVDQQTVLSPHKLDATQNDPASLKTVDFKQDYTILIRKKKYYAVNQLDDEIYTKIYQVNNFIDISTNHRIGGTGSCRINIKGGEKVVAADKAKVEATNWGSFDEIKAGWNSINTNGVNNPGDTKWSHVNGIDFRDLLKTREAKYYWKYAEKADWEPMDEVYVFAKSRILHNGSSRDTEYQFVQIFFGYITSVTKNYGSQGNLTIGLEVEDHLKLLKHTRVFTRPPLDMAVSGATVRYDGFGNIILEDDPSELINPFTEFFAGAEPQEIIRQCAIGAGVPMKYLTKRIEEIKRVPYAAQLQTGNYAELFRSDYKSRLFYCQDAADKLNLEFFADEAGNLVLKIPSYAVNINRQKANYEGDPGTNFNIIYANTSNAASIMNDIKNGLNGLNESFGVNYIVRLGDSLQSISKLFYGDISKANDIWNLNVSRIKNPNSGIINPGESLIITIAKASVDQAISGYKEIKRQEYLNDKRPLSSIENDSLAGKYDYYIRVIPPEDIISFTLTDSDVDIFTAAQVTVEYSYIDSSTKQQPVGVTRAVQDYDLIRQFGYRFAPAVSTPIVGGLMGAEQYAKMIILRSLSGRFTGSLTMIEESSIRIGDPIRFHSYDDYPHTDLVDGDATGNKAQSVYYVDAISRTIRPGEVSTMTLTLKAGRNYGQPSIYDNVQELYRSFYDDGTDSSATNITQDATQVSKGSQLQQDVKDNPIQNYTVKDGDTLSGIANQFYNDSSAWKQIYDANRSQISNPNLIITGMKLKIPLNSNSDNSKIAGQTSTNVATRIGAGYNSAAEAKATELGLTKTSGLRTPAESEAVGGYATDDHVKGIASDFAGSVDSMDVFAKWAKESGLFTKVIWRDWDWIQNITILDGYDTHVHVSWRPA